MVAYSRGGTVPAFSEYARKALRMAAIPVAIKKIEQLVEILSASRVGAS